MTRSKISRSMDLAGLTLVGLALLMFFSQDQLRPSVRNPNTGGPNYGGAAADLLMVAAFWICGSLGILLFLGRPLLWLQWWYSWIVFLAVGGLLWTKASALAGNLSGPESNGDFFRFHDLNVMFVGIACTLMGIIFLIGQALARRAPPEGE